ncbi:6456_t:CDS:2, partial [Entrophospora sp. SA101]
MYHTYNPFDQPELIAHIIKNLAPKDLAKYSELEEAREEYAWWIGGANPKIEDPYVRINSLNSKLFGIIKRLQELEHYMLSNNIIDRIEGAHYMYVKLSQEDYEYIMHYKDAKSKPLDMLRKKYPMSYTRFYKIWKGKE